MPRAVRTDLGKWAIVRFRLAARAAFLIFFRAAFLCFSLAMTSLLCEQKPQGSADSALRYREELIPSECLAPRCGLANRRDLHRRGRRQRAPALIAHSRHIASRCPGLSCAARREDPRDYRQ